MGKEGVKDVLEFQAVSSGWTHVKYMCSATVAFEVLERKRPVD